jgi:hypothetical protein
MQWEWLMTPPRSEVWAVVLGMAFFLTWFVIHFKLYSAFRVAMFAGLGGGFGFAFGNFLQVLGHISEIQFNFWNVMEYSLGFFGGLGMAYGTFTSEWPHTEIKQNKKSNFIPIILVVLFIPFVVWDQSFGLERLKETYVKLIRGNEETISVTVQVIAFSMIIIQTAYVLMRYYYLKKEKSILYTYGEVKIFFLSHFAIYTIFSLLITGAIVSTYRIEQYLYIANYAIILFALPKLKPVFDPKPLHVEKWTRNFLIMILFIAVLAIIAISVHGELNGMQKRFEF